MRRKLKELEERKKAKALEEQRRLEEEASRKKGDTRAGASLSAKELQDAVCFLGLRVSSLHNT